MKNRRPIGGRSGGPGSICDSPSKGTVSIACHLLSGLLFLGGLPPNEDVSMPRYVPKDYDELLIALLGQPDDRKVEADADTGVKATTVEGLRSLSSWPGGLVVETSALDLPELTVKISKQDGAE